VASSYRWSEATRRYIDGRGRFIPNGQALKALEKDLANLNRVTDKLAGDLRAGRISLDAWRAEMMEIIKHTHLGSATLAKGGRAQMQPADYGRVGRIVRDQYGFLESWTQDIVSGAAPLDGRLNSRARLYLKAGRTEYLKGEAKEKAEAGFTEIRSILHPSEHCDVCVAQAEIGWQPIEQMIPIGERTCLANDKCTVEYRKVAVVGQKDEIAALTDADILARPASAYPPARPGERETLNAFTTADGQLTPERQQLHDAIVRQHFQDARPVAEPTVYAMGGGPASGKSAMLDNLETPSNAVTVDPDKIKDFLPEYRDAIAHGDVDASTKVHEESSAIAKRIAAEAARGRYNIIMDGTGDNSYENLARKVAGYRAGGGRVVANYITIDTETAVERAQLRGLKSGRFVLPTAIREIHRNISDILPRAIREGLFDEVTVWDNNGAAGAARVIARYRDGRLTVLDQALWQRFLAKAA
jgi:predicted ABC-type ATPase